ncbi:MAG: hypothetical protein U9O64_08760 [Campylobacterota bacterium]|nr:hypothetical protein [Campylobacterota bacterium]
MKIVIVSALSMAFLLDGCNSTPTVQNTQAFNVNQQNIVKHYKDAYYYRPSNAWSYKLSANSANLNNVASGGILKCKENDIWFISNNDRNPEKNIRYRYMISLSKAQLNKMEDEPEYIPRRDSKEFHDLIEIDTQMAKKGLIGCRHQIPKGRIEKILPQSEVIEIPQS